MTIRRSVSQPLPNRRFRRLLPAALATAAIATSLPLAGPPAARAEAPPRAHVAPAWAHKAIALRTSAVARNAGQDVTGT